MFQQKGPGCFHAMASAGVSPSRASPRVAERRATTGRGGGAAPTDTGRGRGRTNYRVPRRPSHPPGGEVDGAHPEAEAELEVEVEEPPVGGTPAAASPAAAEPRAGAPPAAAVPPGEPACPAEPMRSPSWSMRPH